MVKLPDDVRARLAEAAVQLLQVGDIFWLPRELVTYYDSDDNRFCLVAGLEATSRGVIAHLVPGTSKRARGPALAVRRGETDLQADKTEFDFSTHFTMPADKLVAAGKPRGDISARLEDIRQVIMRSDRAALKRLMRDHDSHA